MLGLHMGGVHAVFKGSGALVPQVCVCGQPKCLCHVWVSGRVDATRGGVHAPRAAHLRRCGEMAQFDVACGAKITQYQPAT